MNKYQEAIKVVDTVLHHICGEEREDGYLPTMKEMSNSMDLLKDLANKADSLEWIPISERLPEPVSEDSESDLNIFDVYLVSIGGENHPRRALWDGRYFCDAMYRVLLDVKAWMPLPKPYKEQENE